jgi:hypothetical protein
MALGPSTINIERVMILGSDAVVRERKGFMARLPPAGVILQATAT